MKALLVGLMLVGTQAFACPDLSGSYACTQDGETAYLELSQTEMNGVTVFTLRDPSNPNDQGGSLPADNQTYRVQDSESFKNATIRGWCEAEAFKIEQTGELYDQGYHMGDIEMVLSMSLMEDGNLLQATSGVFKTGSGDYPLSGEVICSRTN